MTNWIEINGTSYAYSIKGEGETIVLLHGFTGRKETWNEFMTHIGENYQFVTIDLPGHGQTKTNRTVTMNEFVDDLYEFFRLLNIDSFHLLGYSLGGRSALSYAMKYQKSLKSLILESASPGLKTEKERQARIVLDETLVELLKSKGLTHFVSYWENIPLFRTQKSLPESKQEQVRNERLSQTAEGLIQSLRGMGTGAQSSWWENLHTLKIPVLLIVGSLDEKFIRINHEMNRLMKNSLLQIVEDAGHAVHLEQVEKFVKIVKEYIAQI